MEHMPAAKCIGWKLYQIIGKANSQPKEPEAAQDFARHVLAVLNKVFEKEKV